LEREPPTAVTKSVPPIGVNINGVKNETPKTPYFFQIFTNLRFPLVNFLSENLNFLMIQGLSFSPASVSNTTLVIIPKIVKTAVSTMDNPEAIPSVGPAMNLKRLKK